MFVASMSMFVTKVSVEAVMNSSENFNQLALKNYGMETKAVDICLFITAWLAPFTDNPIISYFLLVPIGFTLCTPLFTQMK